MPDESVPAPATYRVKAADVQILQWTGSNVAEMEQFAGVVFSSDQEHHAGILTPWGDWAILDPGNYVVRGVTGIFFIVDADTLADNYEVADVSTVPEAHPVGAVPEAVVLDAARADVVAFFAETGDVPPEHLIAETISRVAARADLRAACQSVWSSALASQADEIAALRRERDLAVAHDTQPYPTAAAYEVAAAVAATLEWAMDEILAQDIAHDDVISLDLTDHIRCFVGQPERASLVPWPADLPRPVGASSSPAPAEEAP